ncbi:glutathione synthase [Clavulina sp. PMI_390]|nr:glutathione synthase [Clavulina sp. PMI_390]
MEWPPHLPDAIQKGLLVEATTFALAHGIAYLPPGQVDTPKDAIHAPFTLLPTPFPRHLFDEANRLQPAYNDLYSRIACNAGLLDGVLGDETGIGRIDAFTGKLWRGWKNLRDQDSIRQPLQLGIFRSDYLVHQLISDTKPSLKQVEFNTISSSFGALSNEVAKMHQHLWGHFALQSYAPKALLPENPVLDQMSSAIASAHKAYGNAASAVLFVVQPQERNVFDQRLLEYKLLDQFKIRSLRMTLQQLGGLMSIVEGKLNVPDHGSTASEIAVVYYRAGYTPDDYHSEQDYETRFMLESSLAIKCPSIPLQLAGTKKIQEVLTHSGVLESLFSPDPLSADQEHLRSTWMDMWGVGIDGGVEKSRAESEQLVLKPQREGGGNNVYRADIPKFLDQLPPSEYDAWIAMRLICTPQLQNWMVKAGSGAAVESSTISELGIYGWSLFTTSSSIVASGSGGWLLRTKGAESNEGGVAVGISVLDAPLLI